jgi:hypothetical protein
VNDNGNVIKEFSYENKESIADARKRMAEVIIRQFRA